MRRTKGRTSPLERRAGRSWGRRCHRRTCSNRQRHTAPRMPRAYRASLPHKSHSPAPGRARRPMGSCPMCHACSRGSRRPGARRCRQGGTTAGAGCMCGRTDRRCRSTTGCRCRRRPGRAAALRIQSRSADRRGQVQTTPGRSPHWRRRGLGRSRRRRRTGSPRTRTTHRRPSGPPGSARNGCHSKRSHHPGRTRCTSDRQGSPERRCCIRPGPRRCPCPGRGIARGSTGRSSRMGRRPSSRRCPKHLRDLTRSPRTLRRRNRRPPRNRLRPGRGRWRGAAA